MKTKTIITLLISVLTASCSLLIAEPSKNIDEKVGWLHGKCLAIKNPNISFNSEFTLVHLNDEKATEIAVIKQKANSGEGCTPLLDDRAEVNKSSGYSFYLVDSKTPVKLAIGIFGNKTDFDFSVCNTLEGIHYSLSEKDSVIWDGYYYIGYEIESNCDNNTN